MFVEGVRWFSLASDRVKPDAARVERPESTMIGRIIRPDWFGSAVWSSYIHPGHASRSSGRWGIEEESTRRASVVRFRPRKGRVRRSKTMLTRRGSVLTVPLAVLFSCPHLPYRCAVDRRFSVLRLTQCLFIWRAKTQGSAEGCPVSHASSSLDRFFFLSFFYCCDVFLSFMLLGKYLYISGPEAPNARRLYILLPMTSKVST